MAWRFTGRARVDPNAPVSFRVCDRCNNWYNITDLQFQYEWAGQVLQNLRLLVCEHCMDQPQPQLMARILPPDPTPTMWARPEPFLVDDSDWTVTADGDILTTQDDVPQVVQNVANNREPAD